MNASTSPRGSEMRELILAARSAFAPLLVTRTARKGEELLPVLHASTELFIVESGLLRSYHLVKDRDVTAHFAVDNNIVGAIDSIMHRAPSRYRIQALEDSVCLVLDYRHMETYLDAHPEHERLARRITQALYFELVERLEGMLFLSARERYDHLLARYPGITDRVGLGHIASHLGMSQETLSRVRAQGRI